MEVEYITSLFAPQKVKEEDKPQLNRLLRFDILMFSSSASSSSSSCLSLCLLIVLLLQNLPFSLPFSLPLIPTRRPVHVPSSFFKAKVQVISFVPLTSRQGSGGVHMHGSSCCSTLVCPPVSPRTAPPFLFHVSHAVAAIHTSP